MVEHVFALWNVVVANILEPFLQLSHSDVSQQSHSGAIPTMVLELLAKIIVLAQAASVGSRFSNVVVNEAISHVRGIFQEASVQDVFSIKPAGGFGCVSNPLDVFVNPHPGAAAETAGFV
jgi:hypothetical protein